MGGFLKINGLLALDGGQRVTLATPHT